jgi:hypothetical protein
LSELLKYSRNTIMVGNMTPPPFRPIVTLATSTIVNDKPESVLIPKVLCSKEELKLLSECMACEHHGGVPNQFVVACKKTDDGGGK